MEAVIEKSFEIEEPIDKVWANLSNPMEVASCVPGAAITQQIYDTHNKVEDKINNDDRQIAIYDFECKLHDARKK